MSSSIELGSQFIQKTALHHLHLKYGAKMVSFAGYEMPMHYEAGIIHEHLHVRSKAGLFDVSHMGQALILPVEGENAFDHIQYFDQCVPNDIENAPVDLCKYTVLMNEAGCILDDMIVTKISDMAGEEALMIVVNAAQKNFDFLYIQQVIEDQGLVEILQNRSLLALQGPKAESALTKILPEVKDLRYMHGKGFDLNGIEVYITRSGYTGEDGFEISVDNVYAVEIAELLLENKDVALIGLGARDSLRLEAGYCLYGQDIDEEINLYEADLDWLINDEKLRKKSFIGAEMLLEKKDKALKYKRSAFVMEGKIPARSGAVIYDKNNKKIGLVTSGGHSPSLDKPIGMAYVVPGFCKIGADILIEVRGKKLKANIEKLPFVPHNVKKKRLN